MWLTKVLLSWIIFISPFIPKAQRMVLWDEKRNYPGIITAQQTPSEIAAGLFLKNVLDQQSRHPWKVSGSKSNGPLNPYFLITQRVGKTADNADQGYTISVTRQAIAITADTQNLIPAVARFLEVFTQCQVYSDTAFSFPYFKTLSIPVGYSETFVPPFKIRLLYERAAFNKLFAQWHGLSNKPVGFVSNDALGWGLWAHSFFLLVPPQQYFSSHPEYFSLLGNQRKPQQLCLSNKQVLQIAVNKLRMKMQCQPEVKYWSVAQMDNENYCECLLCRRTMQEEQTASGPIVRFVNEVAKNFPDKIISTLAYQYSRKPPLLTRPVGNVLIQVCALESDRNTPLQFQNAKGSFNDDLMRWMKLTSNLMIWDYTINFQNIAAPFPNLHSLQPNLLYFEKNNIQYVFEQGLSVPGGGLQDYKAYLLAKLLYRPGLDVDSLKQRFFKGYYGASGSLLVKVVERMETVAQKRSGALNSFDGISPYTATYLSADNRRYYNETIRSALQSVANQPQYHQRADAFAQAFRFVDLELNTQSIGTAVWANNYTSGERSIFKKQYLSLLNEYAIKASMYGPATVKENDLPMPAYLEGLRKKIESASEDNIATNGNIAFVTPYIPDFKGPSDRALIDGVLGTDDWSRTWQGWGNTDISAVITLQKEQSFSFFRMRFILDSANHLTMPSAVTLLSSLDGKNFRQIASITKPKWQAQPSVVAFEYNFATPVPVRSLKVIAQWPGYTKVNDVQYGSFMFTDEIYIR